MLSLPSDLIAEKNKLHSSGAFLELLEISSDEISDTIRIVNNNENIKYNSYTWQRFRFEAGEFEESDEGETQSIQVRVSNISQLVQGYIEEADSGLVGGTVVYRLIHSGYLTAIPAIQATFTIMNCECDEMWVTFTLGMENFYLRRFPAHVFSRQICRYKKFKGSACRYSGSASECNRTFIRCLELGNINRFGGQPGIPNGIYNDNLSDNLFIFTSDNVGVNDTVIWPILAITIDEDLEITDDGSASIS